jgi:hypothetical protein
VSAADAAAASEAFQDLIKAAQSEAKWEKGRGRGRGRGRGPARAQVAFGGGVDQRGSLAAQLLLRPRARCASTPRCAPRGWLAGCPADAAALRSRAMVPAFFVVCLCLGFSRQPRW